MKKILNALFGSYSEFTFENRVYNAIIFTTVLQSLIAFFWNISLRMPVFLNAIILVIAVICSFFYYYSRFKKIFSSLLYLVLACVLLSLVWFLNEGSAGSTPFSFLTTTVGMICISHKKRHLPYIAIILATIGVLLYLENNFRDQLMFSHHTDSERHSDVVFFFIIDLMLIYFIVSFLKDNYDKENKTIQAQKEMLNSQNEEIVSSIKSAEFIQGALLPTDEHLKTILPEHFIFYKPKDIVSGDFYWVNSINDLTIFVAADCTGHGVSGALMSMLGVAFLNEIVAKYPDAKPNQYLDELREKIKHVLNQPGRKNDVSYGMDISLCILNSREKTLQFAGANNSLYLVRNKQLIEYKADKMPVGVYPKETPFTNQVIAIEPNDTFYVCSDGFEDQFGANNKKFSRKKFKSLLTDMNEKPMDVQRLDFEQCFNSWKQHQEQTDDVLVIGIRL